MSSNLIRANTKNIWRTAYFNCLNCSISCRSLHKLIAHRFIGEMRLMRSNDCRNYCARRHAYVGSSACALLSDRNRTLQKLLLIVQHATGTNSTHDSPTSSMQQLIHSFVRKKCFSFDCWRVVNVVKVAWIDAKTKAINRCICCVHASDCRWS